ncbi:MAG TPA: hypothetical protein VF544_08180 [Pyrinomonadaceae bacterium]|jgi:esterase/lipase
MNIVLIETSGNQRYIFATNKLRENIGASELTYQVGTKFVLEAVGRSYDYETDFNGSELRKLLLDETRIEDSTNADAVEIIVATSGKAILLTKNRAKAEEVISKITKRAVTEMPGLTVHGKIWEVKDDLTDIHEGMSEVHHRLEEIRYRMPSSEQRFLRLPFVAPCATSGLPAQTSEREGGNTISVSQISKAKSENKRNGRDRIAEIIGYKLIEPEAIEKSAWIAVIHADGNGLGQIFLHFNEYAGFDQNGIWTGRQYLKEYRKFSLALDVCTIKATKTALEHLWNSIAKREAKRQKKEIKDLSEDELHELTLPVVPLVLGGDDLTVLCDGQYALKFTYDFLTAFQAETKKTHELIEDIVKQIAQRAFKKDYLGICAGVAIVKPHFPFHQGYELAERLLRSAKQVKEKVQQKIQRDGKEVAEQIPCSAFDYHILYDSAHSDLEDIRERLTVDNGETELVAKPYIVTNTKELAEAIQKDWAERRTFSQLERRVNAMRTADEDGKRRLPNSQLHSLREALFLGKDETTARVNLIAHRYEAESKEKERNFSWLLVEDTKTLFFNEVRQTDETEYVKHATYFMDALDVVEFWQGFPEPCKPNVKENEESE